MVDLETLISSIFKQLRHISTKAFFRAGFSFFKPSWRKGKFFIAYQTFFCSKCFIPRNIAFLKPTLILSVDSRVVRRGIKKQFKIIWRIIKSVTINMMNSLIAFQKPTNLFLHYQTVFKNKAITSRIRMFRFVNSVVFRDSMRFNYHFVS